MEFILAQLRNNPDVSYADVKRAADKKKLPVYPIMYGRAQVLLGLVAAAPRGSKKKKAAASATSSRARAGTRRPARAARDSTLDTLEEVIGNMRGVARDRDRYRRALEQISEILESVI